MLTKSEKVLMGGFLALWFAGFMSLAIPAISFGAEPLPSKKPPLPPLEVVSPFEGPYLGVEAGYAFTLDPNARLEAFSSGWQIVPGTVNNRSSRKFIPFAFGSGATAHLNTDGFIGGGVIGYNWRPFERPFIIGVEADFDALIGARRTVTFALPGLGQIPSVAQIGNAWNWAALFGPRVGYAALPNLLVYARGGLSLAQTSQDVVSFSSFNASNSNGQPGKVLPGWFVGGGAEWGFAPGWSAKAEYRHADFGDRTASFSGVLFGQTPNPSFLATHFVGHKHVSEDAVVVGINHKLDFWR